MFGKRENLKRQTRPADNLAQYGIFNMPENLDDIENNFMDNDDDDNDDLEAELAALTADDDNIEKSRHGASRKLLPKERNLNIIVAENMKDINIEEESDGENDPELLNELKMITSEEESSESMFPEKKREFNN